MTQPTAEEIKIIGDFLAGEDWIPWPSKGKPEDWDTPTICSECGSHKGGNSQDDIDSYRDEISNIIKKVRSL